jgi:hypothetical protein
VGKQPHTDQNNNSMIPDRATSNISDTLHSQTSLYHSGIVPLLRFRTGLHGRNVRLTSTCDTAYRISNEPLSHAYVFINKQVKINESVCIQIAQVDSFKEANRNISLSFGCTNCNLNQLFQNDLPVDSYDLLNRKEYWVVNKNILNNAQSGDELCFKFHPNGIFSSFV